MKEISAGTHKNKRFIIKRIEKPNQTLNVKFLFYFSGENLIRAPFETNFTIKAAVMLLPALIGCVYRIKKKNFKYERFADGL